jgi:hypothetical protein
VIGRYFSKSTGGCQCCGCVIDEGAFFYRVELGSAVLDMCADCAPPPAWQARARKSHHWLEF